MFDTNQEFFDSRDMIERIEELEALEANALDDEATQEDIEEFGQAEMEELALLRKFAEVASDYCEDWEYGVTFIHTDYFTDYSRELVSDCGYIPAELPWWIESNIDWDGVADDLKEDYSEFELDGNTYYAR